MAYRSFLAEQKTRRGGETQAYEKLEELDAKQLWHQATDVLDACLAEAFFQEGGRLAELYDKYVRHLREKMNPLRIATFIVAAAEQMGSLEKSLTFVQREKAQMEGEEEKKMDTDDRNAVKSMESVDPEAQLLLHLEMARLNALLGNEREAKDGVLDATDRMKPSFDPSLHAKFHQTTMTYYKTKGDAAFYYRHALLYLNFCNLEALQQEKQRELSYDIAMAALLGEDVYSFGELVQLKVIDSLVGDLAWLKSLLLAFSEGSISSFEDLFAKNASSQAILVENTAFLKQKIRVLALMNLAFGKASDDRSVSFIDIAEHCSVRVSEVELLVMKALALELIRGHIDQVEEVVRIQWVKPRVLTSNQIEQLQTRLGEWKQRVHDTAAFLEGAAPEMFAQE